MWHHLEKRETHCDTVQVQGHEELGLISKQGELKSSKMIVHFDSMTQMSLGKKT